MGSGAAKATVRVVAAVPLLQGGLERAARRAGLRVVGAGEPASFTLRAEGGERGAGLEVAADEARVTVTVYRLPDEVTWGQLHSVLTELLAGRPGCRE